MASVLSDKDKRVAREKWAKQLKTALDMDSWGQSLEAMDELEKLVRMLDASTKDLPLTPDERSVLAKVRIVVNMRRDALADATGKKGIKHKDAQLLMGVLDNLFTNKPLSPFPISLQNSQMTDDDDNKRAADISPTGDDENTADDKADAGTLLPPVKPKPGTSTMIVVIEKLGLKDAQRYFDPHLTVSIVDSKGTVLEKQDTPKSKKMKPQYILFNTTVHIQMTYDEFKKGCTLFFEFRHFKPKKKKVSVRCFAFVEPNEIKNGQPICLELYKKPTDFTKKKIHLFTIKPLYLHITVSITEH